MLNMKRSTRNAKATWMVGRMDFGMRPAFLKINNQMKTGEKLMAKLSGNVKTLRAFSPDQKMRDKRW